jgi:hypothetical protein
LIHEIRSGKYRNISQMEYKHLAPSNTILKCLAAVELLLTAVCLTFQDTKDSAPSFSVSLSLSFSLSSGGAVPIGKELRHSSDVVKRGTIPSCKQLMANCTSRCEPPLFLRPSSSVNFVLGQIMIMSFILFQVIKSLSVNFAIGQIISFMKLHVIGHGYATKEGCRT